MAQISPQLRDRLRADLTRLLDNGYSEEQATEYAKGFRDGEGVGNAAKSLDALAEGASFGWSDEIERGFRGIFADKTDGYNAGLIARRREEFGEDSPASKILLNVTGALAPTVAAMMLPGATPTAAMGAGQLIARAGGAGALGGAVAGVGDAPYGSSPDQMVHGALKGGVIGGATGAAAASVYPLVRSIFRFLGNRTPTGGAARRVMEEATTHDNTTLEEVARRTLEANTTAAGAGSSVPRILAEEGGIGTRGVLEDVAGHPGRGARIINEELTRQGRAGGPRLNQAIGAATDRHIVKTQRDYIAAAKSAQPLYDTFKNKPIPAAIMKEMKALLKTDDGREAYASANRMLQNMPSEGPLPSTTSIQKGRSQLTFGQVDRVLQQIRNKARQLETPNVPGGAAPNPQHGRALRERAGSITTMLDGVDPNYGIARASIRQKEEFREGLKIGSRLMNMPDDLFQETWARASKDTQQGMRVGFRNYLTGKASTARGTAHQDVSRRMPPGEAFERRFSTLFPGGDTDFFQMLQREREHADLAVQGLKNVRTAGRTEAGRTADRATTFRVTDTAEKLSERQRRRLNEKTAPLAIMSGKEDLETLIRKMQIHSRARQRLPYTTGAATGNIEQIVDEDNSGVERLLRMIIDAGPQ